MTHSPLTFARANMTRACEGDDYACICPKRSLIADSIRAVYGQGNVSHVDGLVGVLAEGACSARLSMTYLCADRESPSSNVGPTVGFFVREQFTRTRAADPRFYLAAGT